MSKTAIPGMLVVKAVDGIEMGVLEDGTSFLTGAGLARACGVLRGVIYTRAGEWKDGKRDGKLARLLLEAGYDEPLLYVPLDGGRVHAYTDSVCTIIIEYYALDANPADTTARDTYRRFARNGMREFVHRAVGYDPRNIMPRGWREFYDRLILNTAPPGYFSVFREMSEFILRAAENRLVLDPKTVPDISVGQTWSNFWVANNLAAKYGERIDHEHNYPTNYPQSWSNPQDIWVYPIEACGAFRRWLDQVYVPEKFPAYLRGQVRKNVMTAATMMGLLAAVMPARLEERAETDDGDADDGNAEDVGADEPRRSATARRR